MLRFKGLQTKFFFVIEVRDLETYISGRRPLTSGKVVSGKIVGEGFIVAAGGGVYIVSFIKSFLGFRLLDYKQQIFFYTSLLLATQGSVTKSDFGSLLPPSISQCSVDKSDFGSLLPPSISQCSVDKSDFGSLLFALNHHKSHYASIVPFLKENLLAFLPKAKSEQALTLGGAD